MSAAQSSGDQESSKVQVASEAGASNDADKLGEESLEEHLRLLHHQIKGSDWLQQNTSEMWMEANPEAAAQLKEMFAQKQAAQNPDSSTGQSTPAAGDGQGKSS